MVNDNDTDAVLLDYFSELLRSDESEHKSASTAGVDSLLTLKPQACLQVKVGEQGLLFQLADLSGMQALCGPLIAQADTFWQSEKNSDQVLLDLRPLLSLAAVEYNQSSWQGHSSPSYQYWLIPLLAQCILRGMNNGKFLMVCAIV
jgi:hypothetical protein